MIIARRGDKKQTIQQNSFIVDSEIKLPGFFVIVLIGPQGRRSRTVLNYSNVKYTGGRLYQKWFVLI